MNIDHSFHKIRIIFWSCCCLDAALNITDQNEGGEIIAEGTAIDLNTPSTLIMRRGGGGGGGGNPTYKQTIINKY